MELASTYGTPENPSTGSKRGEGGRRLDWVWAPPTINLVGHERFAGHGYPYGLRGTDIPIGARIVAIADAYDAMVSNRPYRAAIGHDAAIAELREHATMQFDPELVTLFCHLYSDSAPIPDPTLLIAPRMELVPERARPERRRVALG